MRLLILALELSRDIFSGNGVYARSQVRALAAAGHELLLISGRPQEAQTEASTEGAQQLIEVPLPVWGRLDAECSWQEFAGGAGAADAVAMVAAFRPEAVLGVDWHSMPAFEALARGLRAAGAPVPPYAFMNYRIYLRTAEEGHRDIIYGLESRALQLCCLATVLSHSDKVYLLQHLAVPSSSNPSSSSGARSKAEDIGAAGTSSSTAQSAGPGGSGQAGELSALPPVHVLPPALRSDMERLLPPPDAASSSDNSSSSSSPDRKYLACCVRLSPEKQPDRFVDLALELARRGTFSRLGLVPLMLGAGWASPYGQQQKQRIQAGEPQAVLHEGFLGPADLAAVYRQTLLNIHPPTYDAYGMTIVEAGSQGAPSLVQGGGHVGATDLLSEAEGEVLCCDMGMPVSQLADLVEGLLADRQRLAAVGRAAAAKARSWTEGANAEALVTLVQQAVARA